MTSREKKKREKKKSTRKNFAPGVRTRSRARDAPRALETHPIAPKLDERVRNARTETSEKNRTRRGRIEPTTASAASASRAAPSVFPFWKTRRRRRRRRRRESDARDITVSFDRSRFPRNLGNCHKGARRRCTLRQTGRFGRDGRSARFARDRRRATRRRQIKNQQNKPWVARAYAPSFAALVSMCAAIFASGTFVVSSWIDSRRVGVRENSGSGRDARARRRRRRERRSNGKRYRRWLEIARATRRGRAVPAPWPTPGPRVEGSGLLV